MEPIVFCAKANIVDIDDSEKIQIVHANKHDRPLENQADLMKLISVLFSTGINNNDDVFLAEEVLPVRNTGAHKPLNLEHDPRQIIGHMLRTYITLKSGKVIADDKIPESSEFDVTSEAVIYKYLFPDLSKDIKNKALNNELFVSVEAWFTDYDYLVGSKVVRRNSETSCMLDNVLRVNGGDGKFEGKSVGRILRNIIIGGIGVVKHPANAASIIKSVSSINSHDVKDIEEGIIRDNIIGDIYKLSTNSLTRKDEIMKAEVLEELAQVVMAKRAAENIADSVINVDSSSPEVVELNKRIQALEASNKKLEEKIAKEEMIKEGERRSTSLSFLGLSNETVEKCLSRAFFMTSSDFDVYFKEVSMIVSDIKESNKNKGGEAEAATAGEKETVVETKEVTETKPETKPEEKTEVKTEIKAETEIKTDVETTETKEITDNSNEDNTDENLDDVDVQDVEPVDTQLNIETDSGSEVDLVRQMSDVVQKFLGDKNPKWKKLALK